MYPLHHLSRLPSQGEELSPPLTRLPGSIPFAEHLRGVPLGSSRAPPGGQRSEQLRHVMLRDLARSLWRRMSVARNWVRAAGRGLEYATPPTYPPSELASRGRAWIPRAVFGK